MFEQQKQRAASQAVQLIEPGMIVGVGTGSTVNYFIEALVAVKPLIEATVASSTASAQLLKAKGIPVIELNATATVDLYIDGADEINAHLQMIKGGGGALTQEKIIATAAKQFICIVDQSKVVTKLGQFPLPIEVISMARSYVARELVKLGGDPVYRQGVVTDNGHIILDVYRLTIDEPISLEQTINNIPGVVTNGLFALRAADKVIVG